MKRISQSQHDQIVRYAVNYLMNNGFSDIRADLQGQVKPTKITWKLTGHGHIPDVTAQNGQFYLFEVETDDSIFNDHTENQWKLFATYAREHNAKFWVVVPAGSEASVQLRLNELGIQAEVWGCVKLESNRGSLHL
ncbi:MAG: hypothetical protein H8D67_13085 [Deltaproteobacteria bacterium]|nr:hypothetical protein [Deltaproteobacteria bacterium]